MTFEDTLIRNLDRKRASERLDKRSSYIEQAHLRAKEMLSKSENAIQAPEFFDLYGQEKVVEDMLKVKSKQIAFRANKTPEEFETDKVAEVFEAILLEQAELSDWLGGNVTMLKTSLYDDYFHGTDMIAEWHEENREPNILGLAVDVTFGLRGIEKKLKTLKSEVDRGQLGKIKYYRNAEGSIRGERTRVPHVVIGASKFAVDGLARLWMAKDKKGLAVHPIQRIITEEIYVQLRSIQAYAASHGQRDAAQAYQRSLAIIEPLVKEKSAIPLGTCEGDKVYAEIVSKARAMFQG